MKELLAKLNVTQWNESDNKDHHFVDLKSLLLNEDNREPQFEVKVTTRVNEGFKGESFDPKCPPREKTLLGGAEYPFRVDVAKIWMKYGWQPTFGKANRGLKTSS